MSAVLFGQLTYLLGQRRRQYRPLLWRGIVPIKTGIPTWAENVAIVKVLENANEPVPHQIGNQKAPSPSFDRSRGTLGLLEFALSYQIFQAELDRAQVTGINIQDTAVLANQRAAEEFLDKVASLGYATYGLPGLVSSTDVNVIAVTGDWDNNSNESILLDVSNFIFSVFDQSKNLLSTTQLLIPDNKVQTLKNRFNSFGVSLFKLITDANPGVKIVPWFKLRTAGAAGATRMVAFDSSNDVAEMLMVHELIDGKPLEIHGGYEVLQTVKTGGVMIHQPLGLSYADGI